MKSMLLPLVSKMCNKRGNNNPHTNPMSNTKGKKTKNPK